MRSQKFRKESTRNQKMKNEIQTLWENSDPLGAIVLVVATYVVQLPTALIIERLFIYL